MGGQIIMRTIIIIFFSFANASFSSLIFAQYPQMDFPLQIGNVWQFGDGSSFYSESRAVKDTVMPNGLTYTQIIGNLYNGFFRKEGTKIFSYVTFYDTEYVKYDFSLSVGDTVCVLLRWADTTLITVSSYPSPVDEIILNIFRIIKSNIRKYFSPFFSKKSVI